VYTNEAYQKEKVLDATLCSLLSNLQSETKIDTNQNNEIDNALKSMGCN